MDWLPTLKPFFDTGIYPALFVTLFICGVGVPIPEEAIFIAAGYLGHKVGASPLLLCVGGLLGIMAGDSIPFYAGRRVGMTFLERSPWNKLVSAKMIKAVQDYFRTHGAKTVFVARFAAGFRTPAFLAAGSSGMKYRVFFLWDMLGALLSCPTSILIAYFYGEKATEIISQLGVFALIGIIVISLIGYFFWHERGIGGDDKDESHVSFLMRCIYTPVHAMIRLSLKLLFGYEVIGVEKIPVSGPVVLAANHASFIDPIFLSCASPRFVKYLMYRSFYLSWAKPIFDFMRVIPVDEKNYVGALKSGVQALRHGACIGIFPEGAVSYDGRLQPAKEGALFIAQKAGAPILPVTIRGSHAVLPRGAWFPRFRKVTIFVGDPLKMTPQLSRTEVNTCLKRLMTEIENALGNPASIEPVISRNGNGQDTLTPKTSLM